MQRMQSIAHQTDWKPRPRARINKVLLVARLGLGLGLGLAGLDFALKPG